MFHSGNYKNSDLNWLWFRIQWTRRCIISAYSVAILLRVILTHKIICFRSEVLRQKSWIRTIHASEISVAHNPQKVPVFDFASTRKLVLTTFAVTRKATMVVDFVAVCTRFRARQPTAWRCCRVYKNKFVKIPFYLPNTFEVTSSSETNLYWIWHVSYCSLYKNLSVKNMWRQHVWINV